MRQTFAIAHNTFREATRNRIFYSLLLFAVLLLFLTFAATSASLHEEVRLMKDVGLFLISTFSVLIAVAVGVNLVFKEIERKTIYTVASKPIWRWQLLVGKYLGLSATVLLQLLGMGLCYWLQFVLLDASFGVSMVQALWLVFMEVMVVTAVAIFFSSFSTPLLSGMLTLGVFAVGRFVDRLVHLRLKTERPDVELQATLDHISAIARGIATVAPDLSLFNTTPYVVFNTPLPWSYVLSASLYGLSYAAVTLALASLMFSRRDFV